MKSFFKTTKNNTVEFVGDKLEIFLPKRFDQYGTSITDHVECMGIFSLLINDKIKKGFFLPAMITIEPSEVGNASINKVPFHKFTLVKGDKFLRTTEIIMNQSLAFICFLEFIFLGNRMEFMDYDFSALMFEVVQTTCGVNFGVERTLFEIIISHLERMPNNLTAYFRSSDMKGDSVSIPMRAVAQAAVSTSSRMMGSYLNDSINSSLVNHSDEVSPIENLLRQ